MKVRKSLLPLCLLIIITCAVDGLPQRRHRRQPTDFPKEVSLTIDENPRLSTDSYEQGDTIPIRCTFTNRSDRSVLLLLRDHDSYLGTMPYPAGLQARVINSDGKILTQTADFGDWWNSYVFSAGSRPNEMPGDRVALKPGERVIRIVPLAEMLNGLDTVRDGVTPDEYVVQLRLGQLVSNPMKIKVVSRN